MPVICFVLFQGNSRMKPISIIDHCRLDAKRGVKKGLLEKCNELCYNKKRKMIKKNKNVDNTLLNGVI
jgi:hypothetical protein